MSYLANLRTFVRVFELGSMSAAARDQRISPAVASSRISQLEAHLEVRLFQRTTRTLQATEQGRIFYDGARRVLEAIEAAEAAVSDVTRTPRGSIFVSAPLGVGRRFVAPLVPAFREAYPLVDVRLRLSDRRIDLAQEGLDLAIFLGQPEDSTLRIRPIVSCDRIICASPDYIAKRGHPKSGAELIAGKHDCLLLRFPGASEFQWHLRTPDGPQKFAVSGPFETDDGDVLTAWALAGQGIVMKPVFEVAEHLRAGRLIPVAEETPPEPAQLAFLYQHRRHQDPKTRLFIDFMADRIGSALAHTVEGLDLPRRAAGS